jgi:hypothetical protein
MRAFPALPGPGRRTRTRGALARGSGRRLRRASDGRLGTPRGAWSAPSVACPERGLPGANPRSRCPDGRLDRSGPGLLVTLWPGVPGDVRGLRARSFPPHRKLMTVIRHVGGPRSSGGGPNRAQRASDWLLEHDWRPSGGKARGTREAGVGSRSQRADLVVHAASRVLWRRARPHAPSTAGPQPFRTRGRDQPKPPVLVDRCTRGVHDDAPGRTPGRPPVPPNLSFRHVTLKSA